MAALYFFVFGFWSIVVYTHKNQPTLKKIRLKEKIILRDNLSHYT